MVVYEYTALDTFGHEVVGTVEATSFDDGNKSDGAWPISYYG